MAQHTPHPPGTGTRQPRRAALSSFLGTTIEYYDFFVYGSLAALLFDQIFFGNLSPTMGTIAALLTLAAGYVARFVGAAVFGHFGDRIGRRPMLMVTLVVMGLASGAIGLLPTEAQIGVAAPLILLILRIVQGIAVGGEYGGAVLMTAEHATGRRRGLVASAISSGASLGAFLAGVTVLVLTTTLSSEQLLSWGWRVPFLVGFALVVVAVYVRAGLDESPVFTADIGQNARASRTPVAEVFVHQWVPVLKGAGLLLAALAGQGVVNTFLISYAPSIGYARNSALLGGVIGALICVFTAPVYAALSDRIGRRPVLLWGSLGTGIMAFPMFSLIQTGEPAALIGCIAVYIGFVWIAVPAVAPAVLSELFPTRVRYTGVSLSYQLGTMIGAGFSPVIAAAVVAAADGGTAGISWMLAGCTVVSVVAIWSIGETRHVDLHGSGDSSNSTAQQKIPDAVRNGEPV
ncbi:MFS transporter [Gordonia sp. NPDC003376]